MKLKQYYEKIPAFLKNRYAVALMIFVVYVGFMDRNSVLSQLQTKIDLSRLQAEKTFYTKEIAYYKDAMVSLVANPAKLEKFARETYLMKRPDEDIFLFVISEQ